MVKGVDCRTPVPSGEKARAEAAEYAKLLAKRAKEAREKRHALKRRLSSKKSSTSSM